MSRDLYVCASMHPGNFFVARPLPAFFKGANLDTSICPECGATAYRVSEQKGLMVYDAAEIQFIADIAEALQEHHTEPLVLSE